MTDPYEGQMIKILAKIFLMAVFYGIAYGLSKKLWK